MKGLKWHRKTELARLLDGTGAPLEEPRSARLDQGGNWPAGEAWAIHGDALYLLSTYTYEPPSFRRVPLSPGAAAVEVELDVPLPDEGDGADILGLASSPAGVQALWQDGDLDPSGDHSALLWTTIDNKDTARSRRVEICGELGDMFLHEAYWLEDRWLLLAEAAGLPGHPPRRMAVGITERRGRSPVARVLRRLDLEPGRGAAAGNTLLWLQARGRGKARRIELVRLDALGQRLGPAVVLDRRPGPAGTLGDVAKDGALAVTAGRILALWPAHVGRHATLRAATISR